MGGIVVNADDRADRIRVLVGIARCARGAREGAGDKKDTERRGRGGREWAERHGPRPQLPIETGRARRDERGRGEYEEREVPLRGEPEPEERDEQERVEQLAAVQEREAHRREHERGEDEAGRLEHVRRRLFADEPRRREGVRRGARDPERLRIDERECDRRRQRDQERHRIGSPPDQPLDREREHEGDADGIAAVEVRPQQDQRRDRDERATRSGARLVEEIEHDREQHEGEDRGAVGPAGLREHEGPHDDEQGGDERRAAAAREPREEERGDPDEQRAEDREPGPASGVEHERQDDLAEPFADAVRLAAHGRAEDVGAQDLAVIEHPLAARKVPVRVRIARRVADGEGETRGGEADRERVAREPGHRSAAHSSLARLRSMA